MEAAGGRLMNGDAETADRVFWGRGIGGRGIEEIEMESAGGLAACGGLADAGDGAERIAAHAGLGAGEEAGENGEEAGIGGFSHGPGSRGAALRGAGGSQGDEGTEAVDLAGAVKTDGGIGADALVGILESGAKQLAGLLGIEAPD